MQVDPMNIDNEDLASSRMSQMISLQPYIGSHGWSRPLLGRPQQIGLGIARKLLLSPLSPLRRTAGTIMPMH